MSMERISEIGTDQTGATYLLPLTFDRREYNEDEWLYVFVAPLPLAAKFRHQYDLMVGWFQSQNDVHLSATSKLRVVARKISCPVLGSSDNVVVRITRPSLVCHGWP
jgi:hypothetical protein